MLGSPSKAPRGPPPPFLAWAGLPGFPAGHGVGPPAGLLRRDCPALVCLAGKALVQRQRLGLEGQGRSPWAGLDVVGQVQGWPKAFWTPGGRERDAATLKAEGVFSHLVHLLPFPRGVVYTANGTAP